ncbi:MAG: hypothetical protein GX091_08520 [Peptococcaceae bacterium]|nr:hypothetical protein [Peptococcaceae bacterium]
MWEMALQNMSSDLCIFGPTSFQDYVREQGLQNQNTAAQISIDSFERLPLTLKLNDTMVLRLGSSSKGIGTQFLLVKVKGRLRDFFLFDSEVFSKDKGSIFEPVDPEQLKGFCILPELSETSLINLALSSGLIGKALGLDNNVIPTAPATGRSNFTFLIKPHSAFSKTFEHRQGQVEIDALFVEKRDGKDTLFIIEAKSSDTHRSLSKHKLVYPLLAVAQNVPQSIQIVPVYMKVLKKSNSYHFHIVECEFPDPRVCLASIDELKSKKHVHFILNLGC